MNVLPHLLWAGVLIYLVERMLPLVAPLIEARHPKPSTVDPIPSALLSLAYQESEGWARDQMLQTIREHYDETRDWNAVQQRMETK